MTMTPLTNKTIVITRPEHQVGEIKNTLQDRGAWVLIFPVIRISETENWTDCDRAIGHLSDYDWVLFSSANAVRYFMERLHQNGAPFSAKHIAAVGSKTAAVLRKWKLEAQLVPKTFDAEHFAEALNDHALEGKNILIPRSDIARNTLPERLKAQGANVHCVTVYRTETNPDVDAERMRDRLRQKEIDVITFFSPSAVRTFIDLVRREVLTQAIRNHTILAAIGKVTADALIKQELPAHIIPEKSTAAALISAIETYFGKELV